MHSHRQGLRDTAGSMLVVFVLAAAGCGSEEPRAASVSPVAKVDNFGWRQGDRKVAIWTQDPGREVSLVRKRDGRVVHETRITDAGQDADSGDHCWLVDFSDYSEPGEYYLQQAALRSYDFAIGTDVYDAPGRAAMKSFYFQRCNTPKTAPWAESWSDGAPCHSSDSICPRHPRDGTADYGPLDLRGGWHDAGDYQKRVAWNRGMEHILWGYDRNPGAWRDGQLNIPESGNGVPDLLDEASWELDFYVRLQRDDGHFLTVVDHDGSTGNCNSPASCSNEIRVYSDSAPNAASGWGTATLAHAAVLYARINQPAKAQLYGAAAQRGWEWLAGRAMSGGDAALKCVAAAAVFRLDPGSASARQFVESFTRWDTAGVDLAAYNTLSFAAWHYLENPRGSDAIKAQMRTAIASRIVDVAFSHKDAYSGLRGDPRSVWDWHWGSTQNQSSYGFHLMMARSYGITSSRSADELRDHAQSYLHFMLGRNTLNMVYLTNMAAYGGEHSSFQTWHKWFSFDGGKEGSARYNGKPASVVEPLYPYHSADTQTSQFGPAPGLVVGGPNWGYSGLLSPPGGMPAPARAYRDWAVPGCDWDGTRCRAAAWEITETSASYTGAFVGLVSFFMSGS